MRKHITARNQELRALYEKDHNLGFRHEVIVKKLADRFFLATGTVEQIIFRCGVYKES